MDTIGELYYVVTDRGKEEDSGRDINNIGARLTSSPMENLGLSAEFAYQRAARPTAEGYGHRSDYALLVGATYDFPDVAWSPSLGMDYTRLTDDWDPMYEDQTPADIANVIFTNSNLEIIGITATAKPMEDVTARLRLANLRSVRGNNAFTSDHISGNYDTNVDKDCLGNEMDLSLTYDYTEDVQLGLNLGYFNTGKAFNAHEDATQVIGSMKVTF
jgi:predicted porin